MKQTILSTYLVLAVIISVLGVAPTAKGAGSVAPVHISVAGSSSAKADGSSVVTLATSSFWYVCPTTPYWRETETCDGGSPNTGKQYISNTRIGITVSGSGNTLGNTQTDSQGAYVKSGADGSASFTIASTVAETKTVTVQDANTASISISFSTPTADSSPAKPKTTTSTPAPAPTEPTPPEALKTDSIEVDGQAVTSADNILISENESLILKGKTVPNGRVKLYIFSTPREATATADAQGNWSYAVTGLEPGAHHVEAEVTDPTTNKTSVRSTVAAFTVKKVTAPSVTALAANPAKKTFSLTILLLTGSALIVILGGFAGWWFWRRRRTARQLHSSSDANHANPDDQSKPDNRNRPLGN